MGTPQIISNHFPASPYANLVNSNTGSPGSKGMARLVQFDGPQMSDSVPSVQVPTPTQATYTSLPTINTSNLSSLFVAQGQQTCDLFGNPTANTSQNRNNNNGLPGFSTGHAGNYVNTINVTPNSGSHNAENAQGHEVFSQTSLEHQ